MIQDEDVTGIIRRKVGDAIEIVGIRLDALLREILDNLDRHLADVATYTMSYYYDKPRSLSLSLKHTHTLSHSLSLTIYLSHSISLTPSLSLTFTLLAANSSIPFISESDISFKVSVINSKKATLYPKKMLPRHKLTSASSSDFWK